MEVENSIFASHHHHTFATSSYFGHQSPPYALLDLLHQPPDDAAFPMQQHLRFPTPPISPEAPRSFSVALHIDLTPQLKRTQSVIMKVGQGRSHVATEICALDDSQIITHEATTSESSSSPSSSDYVCDWIDCGRYFESLESLAGHVTQVHAIASPVDGLYYCRWTGCLRTDRGFNARYKMLVHVRTHTKEKPHQCHLCEKSFSRAENLKIHIRSHSGEKPYVCTYEGCLKAYSNSSDRFKHTRTHSMDKPYLCKVKGCMKRYTDPSSLRKHVKTFKHSLQLIDTEPISNKALNHASQHTAAASDILSNQRCHHNCCLGRSKEEQSPAYLCMRLNASESSHSGYYMAIESEDDCHIRVNQVECYYDTAVATRHRNAYQSYALHRDDFAMDQDTPPLDLRVKRI